MTPANDNAGFDRLTRKVFADIERVGRSVIGVFPDAGRAEPAFCYTIGNDRRAFPELLLIGGCTEPFADILNELSVMAMRRKRPFADGERVYFPGGRCPVMIVAASDAAKDRFTVQAGNFLGTTGYGLQQVVLSDKDGRLPGEPGCAEPYASVPIMRRTNA